MTVKLIFVEEALNKRKQKVCKSIKLPDIDNALRQRKAGRTAVDYVIEALPARGFKTSDGEADWVRFYKYARIDPSVWSTFTGNTHAPSKETLLKIVIGLRLCEHEAQEFLSLAGGGFRSEDFRDQVILACMDCGYYEIEDVYEILEEYGSAIINGKRRFKNLY